MSVAPVIPLRPRWVVTQRGTTLIATRGTQRVTVYRHRTGLVVEPRLCAADEDELAHLPLSRLGEWSESRTGRVRGALVQALDAVSAHVRDHGALHAATGVSECLVERSAEVVAEATP